MATSDLLFLFRWWLVFFVFGVINIPVSFLLFKKFVNIGYGFSKILTLVITSYCMFVLATFKLLPFTESSILVILGLLVLMNLVIVKAKKAELQDCLKRELKSIFLTEILFSLGLFFWALIRSYQPDINGLEKFMDYGFINSILNSKYFPPVDMWFSGQTINYYWFGHMYTALVTKLTNIPSSVTYNLMLATIMGICLSSSFTIVSSLVKISFINSKKLIYIGGLLSALLLTFGGNFHAPFYIIKNGYDNYWYPDATRFIGYNPDVNDKTIHEFPMYSFVVSDLHAHLLNLPFVLLYIGLLASFFVHKDARKIKIFMLSLVLSILFMTSAWDFANYSVLTGILFLIFAPLEAKSLFRGLFKNGLILGLLVVLALIFTTPFLLNFESIAQGVRFVHTHTPLWQLLILWGFPLVLTVIFFPYLIWKRKSLMSTDLFAAGLIISCWILIILPEVIYLKDIYAATHYRANTMFKLTYQAFVMSYLSAGYILIRAISSIKNLSLKTLFAIAIVGLSYSLLIYAPISTNSYYGVKKVYKGLSGDTWVKNKLPETYKAIAWLKENVVGQQNILEAPGDSYTEYNIISSYTGLPTVSGWFVHEWLWRGSPEAPQKRVAEIQEIYTSSDVNKVRSLLQKHNISYVVVGKLEKEKFPLLNEPKFLDLGEKVYVSSGISIYKIN